MKEHILILDFGSQSTHLIARRLNDLGFEAHISPPTLTAEEITKHSPKGIIFSGSPDSVYEENALNYDTNILDLNIPKLGICYGFQCTVNNLNGKVESSSVREYGECPVSIIESSPIFTNLPNIFTTWMSHGDSIVELSEHFSLLAESNNHPAAAYCSKFQFWGLQFHPELSHSECGKEILNNFAEHICGLSKNNNTMDALVSQITTSIQNQIGDNPVLILVSGGVDSTVAAALLLKSLDPSNVHLMYIDTGLMRKNETEEIKHILSQLQGKHIHIIRAEDEFLNALTEISDPEEKRNIIGDLFVSITIREVKKLGLPQDFYLAQGTLYTDLIESGQGVGANAKAIKSHHNVNSPLIKAKRESGKLLEPLKDLYKDNARQLGLYLGLPEQLIYRHPFPGPGLGVRILGEITKEKCLILQKADAIYLEELHKRNLYHQIWQAFAVLIPVKTVGVVGDIRRYGYSIALRAVNSSDGVSADIFDFPMKDLKEISSRITNEITEVSRVVYDISSKPPATIEWE
ncbi:MAG: glutamine-hydrolyzing GMP synthase [Brevinemataceae bacterium]